MRARRWTRSVVAGALGVALVIATSGTAGASDETTATKLVITKADVARAHVGRGFVVGTPGGSGDAATDTFASLADCVGTPVTGRAVVAAAHGPDVIDQAHHSEISSNVDIVQTKAMAETDREVVASPAFPDCLARLAEPRGASANAGVTSVDGRRANVKRCGDYSTAVLIQLHGNSNGAPTTVSAIEVLTQRGRAELSAEFLKNGATPYDRQDAEKILAKVAQRLDAAKV